MNQIISIKPLNASPVAFDDAHVPTKRANADDDATSMDYSAVLASLSDAVTILKTTAGAKPNGTAISAITRAMRALKDPLDPASHHKNGGLAGWQCTILRKYVDDNLHDRISITSLAQAVDLSTSHFCRSFRASFDCSPTQFIMNQRIDRARRMLAETSEPLSQIAFDCGFSDQSHFSRIFHDVTGETPWRWRKERKAKS